MNDKNQKEEKRLVIKQWLSRAYKIDQQITNKLERIQEWQELAQRTTSCAKAAPNGNQNKNKIEEYTINIIQAQKNIESEMEELINAKREIEYLISKIENPIYKIVLEQRYLLGKRWIDIAEKLNYTEEYTKRNLHNEALRQAEKRLH